MQLTIQREDVDSERAIGRLYVDSDFECYTLEDPPRDVKIQGVTAIPAGRYPVYVTYSPRFGRLLPLLHGVPGFTGIRIHPGNTAKDTEGCILVGRRRSADEVYESRLAFDALFAKIEAAHEGVALEIRDAVRLLEEIPRREIQAPGAWSLTRVGHVRPQSHRRD